MGQLINVKELVGVRRENIQHFATQLTKRGFQPSIKVLLVGEQPASMSYVKGKEKTASDLGIKLDVLRYPDTVTEAEILRVIDELNEDKSVHGFIVQLPLPKTIDTNKVIEAIHPEKDIDGFHPLHLGEMMIGVPTLLPCTPKAIMAVLEDSDVELFGQHVVVVGRSNIVGKPVAMLALENDATVTVCHSKTQDLKSITQSADILIVAVGIPHFIQSDAVKKDAVIIDVGVNRDPKTNKLVGDVNTEDVLKKASLVTPVPGGVGPMTITMLMQNTIEAVCRQKGISIESLE